MSESNNNSAKLIFSLIIGIPVLVIAFSTLLYQLANRDVIDLDTVNNGQLIQPPVAIDTLSPVDRNGRAIAFNTQDSRWQFLVVGDAACEAACEKMLYLTRQTHTALGKKMPRVGRIYLNLDASYSRALEQLLDEEHENLAAGFADGAAYRQAEGLLLRDESPGFYVVDPRGWIMMYYRLPDLEQETLAETGKLVIKDMKRLLR